MTLLTVAKSEGTNQGKITGQNIRARARAAKREVAAQVARNQRDHKMDQIKVSDMIKNNFFRHGH